MRFSRSGALKAILKRFQQSGLNRLPQLRRPKLSKLLALQKKFFNEISRRQNHGVNYAERFTGDQRITFGAASAHGDGPSNGDIINAHLK